MFQWLELVPDWPVGLRLGMVGTGAPGFPAHALSTTGTVGATTTHHTQTSLGDTIKYQLQYLGPCKIFLFIFDMSSCLFSSSLIILLIILDLKNMINCGLGQVRSVLRPQSVVREEREMFLCNSLSLFLEREDLSRALSSSGSTSGWTMSSQDRKFSRRRSSVSARLLSLPDSRSGSDSRILICMEAERQVILEAGFIVCLCTVIHKDR